MLKKRLRFIQPLGILLLGTSALTLGTAFAGEQGYVLDGAGQPVRDSSGECLHTDSWNKAMPLCPQANILVEDDLESYVYAIDDAEYFGFNQATLSDRAKSDLDRLVADIDKADQIKTITVTGHADKIGSIPYNRALAFRRADAVKAYLVSQGIPAKRISTESEGSGAPLVACSGDTPRSKMISCLAPNRRVDLDALLASHIDVRTVDFPQSGS